MSGLSFYLGDMYPGMSNVSTDAELVPDKDDQQALNESADIAEQADAKSARKFPTLLAVGAIVLVAIFFGVGD